METIQNLVESVKESATTALHKTEDFLGIPHEMTEEEARQELGLKAQLEPGYDPDWHKSDPSWERSDLPANTAAIDPNPSVIVGNDPISDIGGVPPHMYLGDSPQSTTRKDFQQAGEDLKDSARRQADKVESWATSNDAAGRAKETLSDAATGAKAYARRGLHKAEDALDIKHYDSPPEERRFTESRGGSWKDVKETVKDSGREIRDSAKDARERVKDQAYNTKESVKDSARDLKDAKPDSSFTKEMRKEEAKESGKQMLHGAKEAVKDSAKSASEYTKQSWSDKPFDEQHAKLKAYHDDNYQEHKDEALEGGKTFLQAASDIAWDTAVGAKEAAMNVLGFNQPGSATKQ